MLSDQEKTEIETEIRRYERRSAACVDALKVVQRHRGWVSDEALADVAEILGMTTHELDSVATFYNLIYRRPVGKQVILVCDTISCWVVGQQQVFDHLKMRLGADWGQTTADGRFTLLPVPCLGVCEQAPAVMIGNEVYGDLTPEKLDRILERLK
ncbi:MAG: NADH-quinone oxidoreductase subunit E [Nitrospirae bacterium GWD2_57_9]|nr:MAG: NADH-quinone oxidoreductase subunit E [Nitrospirae bacterium GWD2_57_9]